MARPKPTIILEHVDPKTYRAEEILEAEAIYAVYYKDTPINLRTLSKLVSYPGPKYKKASYSSPAPALNLAKRLNKLFKTSDFTVFQLIAGKQYTGKDDD